MLPRLKHQAVHDLQELYSNQYLLLGGISTGFTVGTHIIMSLLLIIRQGWLQAASQACGFILTLNPFESLRPIPQGILGLFVISIGFIAYVLIAASGDWLAARSGTWVCAIVEDRHAAMLIRPVTPAIHICIGSSVTLQTSAQSEFASVLTVCLFAAAGLIFVAYCVLCYLVTALLFSLLILDLATLVITVAPSKAIFKYTDLVYTGAQMT